MNFCPQLNRSQTLCICVHRQKLVYTLSSPRKIAHSGSHAETWGFTLAIGGAFRSHSHIEAMKSRRKRMHALWRVSASYGAAAPLGCATFLLLSKLRLVHPRSGPFCMCEARGVSPLSACSTCRRNARCPLVKAANSPFPCLARFFFDSSSAKYCPLSLQMPKGPAGYPLVLSLLFASPYLP